MIGGEDFESRFGEDPFQLAADGVASIMNHVASLSKLTSLNNSLQQIAGMSDKLELAELFNLEYILKDDLNYLIETSGEVAGITAYFMDERVCASSGSSVTTCWQ